MNRYLIIHRLRWPAILLLTGVIALLDQADVLSWGRAWPLYLILFGVFALAERATFAQQPPVPTDPYGYPVYPQQGYPNSGYPAPGYPAQSYPAQPVYTGSPIAPQPPASSGTGIVPASSSLGLSTRLGSNREEEER